MPYYSVEDFDLPYPTWSRPLRRIRKGAMTAFVDKASGELVAGYSYTTCLYAVVESAEYPTGQLFENLTTYSVTTSGKHSWPLRCRIADHLKGSSTHDWVGDKFVEVSRVQPSAPICTALDVPQGTTAAELVVRCRMQLPVNVAIASRIAKVDAYNAAIDDGNEYPDDAADRAERDAQLPFWRTVRDACDDAERAERRASEATYGNEYDKRRARERRAQARAETRQLAEAGRGGEAAATAMLATQANLPAARTFVIDGKVYGQR